MTIEFGQPQYGLTRVLNGLGHEAAIPAVKEALASQGFGVLTEIDMKATMKKKLDVDLRPYVILGACNPPLALQALSAEPGVGLLLPCNVVVTEDEKGNAVVSAIDPIELFRVVGNPSVAPLAAQVRDKIERALEAIKVPKA